MDFTYYFVLGYSCSVVMATGDVVLVVKVGVVTYSNLRMSLPRTLSLDEAYSGLYVS